MDIHYISHITGHGLRKIARAKRNLSYVIDFLPEPQEEFSWLMEKGPVSRTEAHRTWNVGLGIVVFLPEEDIDTVDEISKTYVKGFEIGHVEAGPRVVRMPFEENGKQVILVP